MKNYVAFNAKYYKNSNASGEIGHVQRVFHKNKNAIEELTFMNFGCGYDIYERYKETYKKVEEIKGKKIQENSNTFMDGVLAFSNDQIIKLMEEDPNWKKSLSNHIEMYMQDVKKATGLEPLGWEMHMDEGHTNKDGINVINYHAQLIFFNFDFETKKAPLRDLMGRKGDSIWSKLQDLAGQRFEPLGFQRGLSADMTKIKHKEKDQYIDEKHKELEQKIELLEEQIDQQFFLLEKQQNLVAQVVEKVQDLTENYNNTVDYVNNTLDKKEVFSSISKKIKTIFKKYDEDRTFKKSIDRMISLSGQFLGETAFSQLKGVFNEVKKFFIDTNEDPKYNFDYSIKEVSKSLNEVKNTLYENNAEIEVQVKEIKKRRNKLRI